ncbi:uncharacterized protein ccdc14 isoform X2 [Anabas testudineus]|uniref:uncharacterized protein ccdc14 isoform X2 n=1 Tax=Anabas testudineus TaxID=64144 RepID=UPI000E463A15|nr:uncharacterized protein ccdc14 isoform X2 [Anabas testudineus]
MKGADRRKVVTSGRLTGGAKGQLARKQVAPNPAASAVCPEPAYSLYSTDSEDQVTTLHKGLDRCAALLGGILQAEKAVSPSFPRTVTAAVAKSRPSTSLGKKSIKKLPTKTVQKSSQSPQCGAGTTTPRPSHRFIAAAAHSGVKLHPPRKQPHARLQSHDTPPSRSKTLFSPKTPSALSLQTQPSVLLSVVQSSSHSGQLPVLQAEADAVRHCDADCDGGEEDLVPVRDINTVTDTHAGVHLHTCTMKMSNQQLEPAPGDEVPQDTDSRKDCSAETDVKVKTVQYLLGELKALIAGQGSVAEMLLSHLEQTVSSPQMNDGSSIIQTVPDASSLHSQNTQLRRRVRVLEQQLKEKEKADRQQNTETLSNSEVSTLQNELATAQSRLQELHDDLTELRIALQDTQSQLSDREAENKAIKTDLESTRSRLVESERKKSELATLAQQRLEEIENLTSPAFSLLQNASESGFIRLCYSGRLRVRHSANNTTAAQGESSRAPHRSHHPVPDVSGKAGPH